MRSGRRQHRAGDAERNRIERDSDENESEGGFPSFHRRTEFRHNPSGDQTRIKSMNSSNQDKAEGTAKKAMGTIKEKTGEAIGNPDLRDRGTAEKVEGKVQNKVGDVKKVFDQ